MHEDVLINSRNALYRVTQGQMDRKFRCQFRILALPCLEIIGDMTTRLFIFMKSDDGIFVVSLISVINDLFRTFHVSIEKARIILLQN